MTELTIGKRKIVQKYITEQTFVAVQVRGRIKRKTTDSQSPQGYELKRSESRNKGRNGGWQMFKGAHEVD